MTLAPAARFDSVHTTVREPPGLSVLELCARPGSLEVALPEVNVTPAGIVSVTATPRAVPVPLLATVTVHVPVVPAVTLPLSGVFVIARSGVSRIAWAGSGPSS